MIEHPIFPQFTLVRSLRPSSILLETRPLGASHKRPELAPSGLQGGSTSKVVDPAETARFATNQFSKNLLG